MLLSCVAMVDIKDELLAGPDLSVIDVSTYDCFQQMVRLNHGDVVHAVGQLDTYFGLAVVVWLSANECSLTLFSVLSKKHLEVLPSSFREAWSGVLSKRAGRDAFKCGSKVCGVNCSILI